MAGDAPGTRVDYGSRAKGRGDSPRCSRSACSCPWSASRPSPNVRNDLDPDDALAACCSRSSSSPAPAASPTRACWSSRGCDGAQPRPATDSRPGVRHVGKWFAPVRNRIRHGLSGDRRSLTAGCRPRRQVDRQFRHSDPDLRHARLGAEHRGRPRRPARPRLRRLLRGRRLLVRLLAKTFRAFVSGSCLPLAGILACVLGHSCSAFPVLRLRGDYLAIVTLAFGEIIRLVLDQLGRLRPTAMPASRGIPRPTFFGIPFNADDDGFAADLRT